MREHIFANRTRSRRCAFTVKKWGAICKIFDVQKAGDVDKHNYGLLEFIILRRVERLEGLKKGTRACL